MKTRRDFMKTTALAAGGLVCGRLTRASEGAAAGAAANGLSVTIVGAGLAGLTAAYELQARGFTVTLLEAQSRAGGRVKTLRDGFAEGLYADVGAGRIPEIHDLTLHYAKRFDLRLEPFAPATGVTMAFVDGRRLPLKPGVDLAVALGFSPEEKKLGLGGMVQKYIFDAVEEVKKAGDPTSPDWPPKTLSRLDEVTLPGLFRREGASAGAIKFFTLGSYPDRASSLYMLRLLALGQLQNMFRIAGGNDLLPAAFASRLADRIRYGAEVVRMEQTRGRVRVTHTGRAGRDTVESDYVVCALPFPVLRTVEVVPRFSAGKERAIKELAYAPVVKTTIQCRERYWEREGLSGFARTDYPCEIWSLSWNSSGRRGLLQTYAEGRVAELVGRLTREEQVANVAGYVDKVFPGLRENCEGALVTDWGNDRWARGAYAAPVPGQMMTLVPHIGAPEGRIFFAGEHVSAWPGWMQGALASAQSVVQMIVRAAAADESIRFPA